MVGSGSDGARPWELRKATATPRGAPTLGSGDLAPIVDRAIRWGRERPAGDGYARCVTVATHLDAVGLRAVVIGFRDALVDHREVLNLLNVYPVPDGDTGTNMSMTAQAAVSALEELEAPDDDLGAVTGAVAHGSLMGARGNSGVILSQVLRALCGVVGEAGHIDGRVLADGLAAASEAAYGAVGQPVEGTILTVVRESSEAAVVAADMDADLLSVAEAARERAGDSLARTPDLLPILAEAGVVDAGASGYVLFLDAFLTVADGRPLPEPPEVSMAAAPLAVDREAAGLGLDGGRYEVMFFLDAADDTVPGFKDAWGELGDSVVVVGGDGVWNCHVHTDDIGAAVEAGIAVGRPHRIRISDLLEEAEEQAWVREQIGGDEPEGEPVSCAVVAVANGPGIVEIFRSLGVHRVVAGGQSMNPSTADLLAAVEAVPAGHVVILPNNGNIVAVAEQVDAQTDKTVRVVRTKSITEGFSSLLEYDPEGTADANLGLMGEAAATVVAAEVTVAVRDSGSEAGDIATGDHLGLSGGKVRVIAGSLLEATTRLLDELLDGDHEIITLIAGDDADEFTTARVVAHVKESHPHVAVEVHEGGQPLYPYFVGIE